MQNENNNISVISFERSNHDLFYEAKKIRQLVFVQEQNVAASIEFDGLDDMCLHYLIYRSNKAVGTARWRITDKGIKLERFAISKSYRGRGIGQLLLDAVMKDLNSLNQKIYLHSQESAVEFYKKNNFIISGSSFIEADIVHFMMIYGG